MLVKFQDRIYAKSEIGILIWDHAFQNFRPCESIVWNPVKKCIEPFFGAYVCELFDRDYGYGDHRTFCTDFTDKYLSKLETASEIKNVYEFWKWTGQELKWTGDCGITIHPCHKQLNKEEYYRVLNLRRKTYKNLPRQIRGTRKVFRSL